MNTKLLLTVVVGITLVCSGSVSALLWNSSYDYQYLVSVNASENQLQHFVCMNISTINGSVGDLALVRNDSGTWHDETWWWKGDRRTTGMEWYVNDSICWRVNLTADVTKNWYVSTSDTPLGEHNSSGLLWRDSGEVDATWTDATYMTQESGGVDGDYFLRFSPTTSGMYDYMTFPAAFDDEDFYICWYQRLTSDSRNDNYFYVGGGSSQYVGVNSMFHQSNGNLRNYDGGYSEIDGNYASVWLPICFKGFNTTGASATVKSITNSTHQIAVSDITDEGTITSLTGIALNVGGGGSGTAQHDLDSFIILDGYDLNLYLIQPTIVLGAEETSAAAVTFNVSINSPSNQTVTGDNTSSHNFTAIGTEATYDCTLYYNDTSKGNNASVQNNTPTTITSSEVSNGGYSWYVNCSSGSTTNQSEIYYITINTDMASVSAPTIVPSTLYETQDCTALTTVTDEATSILILYYNWTVDGVQKLCGNKSTLSGNETSVPILGAGNYSSTNVVNITVKGWDGLSWGLENSSEVTVSALPSGGNGTINKERFIIRHDGML